MHIESFIVGRIFFRDQKLMMGLQINSGISPMRADGKSSSPLGIGLSVQNARQICCQFWRLFSLGSKQDLQIMKRLTSQLWMNRNRLCNEKDLEQEFQVLFHCI